MYKLEDEIFETIKDYVTELTSDIDHGPISRDSMLSPLGLDSIGRAILIEKMLELFALRTSRFEFQQVNNLGELAELFAKKINDRQIVEGGEVEGNICVEALSKESLE